MGRRVGFEILLVMMKLMLLVGLGSFFGGALRYLVSTLTGAACGTAFPWGTLAVNLLGCTFLGVVLGLFTRFNASLSPWCLFFSAGFCGGFTTFSTFANESLRMLQGGDVAMFLLYVALSSLFGILLLAVGYYVVK